jgi:hypothetical protein
MARLRTISLLLAIGISIVSRAADADEVLFQSGQTDQFAGAMCPLRIDKPAGKARDQIGWRMTAGNRTLAEGRAPLAAVATRPDALQFVIPTPEVENGVVLEAKLTLAIEGIESPAAVPLRLRGKNPFESVRKTLAKAGIAVWDPAETTGHRLAQLELPFQELKSLGGTNESAVIILGEDALWDRETPSVAGELVKQGKLVIALRPQSESAWPMTLSAEGLSQFRCLHWPESGLAPPTLDIQSLGKSRETRPGWAFTVSRESFQLVPGNSAQVWDLVESHAVSGGHCLWIGAPVMSGWDLSPVSRELLAHILISRINDLPAVKAADPK